MLDSACTVDWPGVVDVVKNVIVALAAIATATVAYTGISQWRAVESGKADFDLARRLGTAVYRFRNALAAVRYRVISANEFPEGTSDGAIKKDADAYAHVFNQRLQGVRQSDSDLRALRNEAEALWGKDIVGKLDELLYQGAILQSAIRAFVADIASLGADFKGNPEFGKEMRATAFDTGNKINADGTKGAPNAFTVKIEQAVEDVAAYLRTKLPQRSGSSKSHD